MLPCMESDSLCEAIAGRCVVRPRSSSGSPIDALIVLAAALDRVETRPEPVRRLGWLG
jgi:hypothetical protein